MNTRVRNELPRTGSRPPARTVVAALIAAGIAWGHPMPSAAESEHFRTVEGLNVYLGMLPAAMTRSQLKTETGPPLHGGTPRGEHVYHVTIAVFDAASGERQENLDVRARVSGIGLSGPEKALQPMALAGTVTYGNYFRLPGNDTYRIHVEIRQPGKVKPVMTDFSYEHRLR